MTKYNVTGMTCAACQAHVEKAVNSVEGVTSCAVNLLTNSMQVDGDVPADKIIKAVEDAGYGASVQGAKADEADPGDTDILKDTETPKMKKRSLF